MGKVIRHALSAVTALAVGVSALAVFPVQAAEDGGIVTAVSEQDDSIIHITEAYSADGCTVLDPEQKGEFSFDVNKRNYNFDLEWKDTGNVTYLAGDGMHLGFNMMKYFYLNYSGQIDCSGGYGFGAAFLSDVEINRLSFTGDKRSLNQADVHIYESYSGLTIFEDDELLGSVEVNGAEYDIYQTDEEVNGMKIDVLNIVRRESLAAGSSLSGKIDLKEFIDALADKDIRLMNSSYPQMMLFTEGGSGSAEITRNELISVPYTDDMEVPNYDNEGRTAYRDGTTYTFLQDDRFSRGNMIAKEDGTALCTYFNVDPAADCLFKKGIVKENGIAYDDVRVEYVTSISNERENNLYAAGINFDFADTESEFYIVHARKSDDFIKDAELIGTFEIDDLEYTMYKKTFDAQNIQSGDTYTQYWCVSSYVSNHIGYTMHADADLSDFVKAWEKLGVKAGEKLCGANAFAEIFGKGDGKFTIEDVNVDIKKPSESNDVVLKDDLTKNGYRYYATGAVDNCTLEENGTISADIFHEHDEMFSVGKGFDFGERELENTDASGLVLSYKAKVSTDGRYWIGAYGRMRGIDDELNVAYHIIDHANYDPVPPTAIYCGSKEINGVFYRMYVDHTKNTFGSGRRSVDEYYSIRDNLSSDQSDFSEIIYLDDHIKAWREFELTAGNISSAYINADMGGVGGSSIEIYDARISVFGSEPDDYIGEFDTNDAVFLNGFLLGKNVTIPKGKNYDLNGDGAINSFDLIKLRQVLAESM